MGDLHCLGGGIERVSALADFSQTSFGSIIYGPVIN